jgi:hypothetical protein
MINFIYYRKLDQTKEPLGKGRFADLEEAINIFAKIEKI